MTPRRRWYAKARAKRTPGTMNGLESAYADRLEMLRLAGEIRDWKYEAITLKLAPKTTYTPDFAVVEKDGTLEFHETKGFMREDAHVKLKTAAALFPWFRFVLVTRDSKRDGGAWHDREIDDGRTDQEAA